MRKRLSMLVLAASSLPVHGQTIARPGPFSGTIVSTKIGEQATLLPDPAWREARPRQQLKAGDVLRTNANGTLAILFADRTQMRLGRNTVLVVKAVSAGAPSSVALQQGQLWARAPRNRANLSVETPSATAAIRGTEWSLSVNDDRTSLQVFDGKVNLANDQGAVDVMAGQAGLALRGRAPTRVVLADPVGREQILYFVRLEDGRALLPAGDTRLADSLSAGAPPPLVADQPASYVAHGFWLAYAGDLRGALATIDQGKAMFPGDAALRLLEARVALLLGEAARARVAVEAALALSPNDGRALALRAEIKAAYDGQPWAALADAQAAVRADPSRGASYGILGDIYLERSADKEAVAALRTAVVRDPDNAGIHARLASAYLQQNRLDRAKPEIDRAVALDPTLSIVRSVLGQYHIQRGEPEAARDDMLAASSDNPGYAPALVSLAEMEHRLGNTAVALQQLDAADRLDPQSPLAPLARTAIALHIYDADGAIVGAREALTRFRKRGGVYSSLSENRTTGSYLSQAFRFLRMEEWGRYYGERVFDSFTPSSYFDQGLNFQVDPYVGTQLEPVGFDPDRGRDLSQLSSFMQGLALDPLAVTYPKRTVQFTDEAFFEPAANLGFTRTRFQNRPIGFLTLDGLGQTPVPTAYSLTAGYRERNLRGGGDGPDELNSSFVRGWLGAEPGAYDNLVAFVNYEDADNDYDAGPRQVRTRRKDLLALGFYNHKFGQREVVTLGLGHGDRDANSVDRAPPGGPASGFTESNRFWFASASYMRGRGRLDVRSGVEASWARSDHDARAVAGMIASLSRFRQQRGYVDLRWSPDGPLTLEGQVAAVHSRLRVAGPRYIAARRLDDYHRNTIDFRASAAWSPVAEQWLRLGFFRQTSSDAPFTFAPTDTIGLRPAIVPGFYGGQYESLIAQWDVEWTPRVFTTIDYQRQRFDALLLSPAIGRDEVGLVDARIDRLRGSVNIWPGDDLGLAATYMWSDARGQLPIGTAFAKRALPFVPRHFAQASITWAHPSRLRIQFRETWASAQRDFAGRRRRAGFVGDVSIVWEPFDKRAEVKLNVENVFATDRTQRPTQGRIVSTVVAWRF